MISEIKEQVRAAVLEFLPLAKLAPRDLFVVGCSSSEIAGAHIGKASSPDIAASVLTAILPLLKEKNIWLAAQCCEHLNRVLIVERAAAEQYGLAQVNAVPQPKAGGSFAAAAYAAFSDPVAVESIAAHAGFDIGDTLIGMHLRPVAVPVRLSVRQIGQARLVCARTRPKFVGGVRAVYDERLL